MKKITFAEFTLTEDPVTLPVIYFNDSILAIEKPAHLNITAHPWYPFYPALTKAIQQEITNQRPLFTENAINEIHATHHLDSEASGVTILTTTAEKASELRNVMGSSLCTFHYLFLAKEKQTDIPSEFTCELPIANHSTENHTLVSHKTGKKTLTHFQKITQEGLYSIWKASTTYNRLHQIRLHAFENGLYIVGDPIYGNEPEIFVSALKKRYKNKGDAPESSLYQGTHLHLQTITLPNNITISAPLPAKMAVVFKKLSLTLPENY